MTLGMSEPLGLYALPLTLPLGSGWIQGVRACPTHSRTRWRAGQDDGHDESTKASGRKAACSGP